MQLLLPYKGIWRLFLREMILKVDKHGVSQHTGFINTDDLTDVRMTHVRMLDEYTCFCTYRHRKFHLQDRI